MKNVVFDIGGVLLRWNPLEIAAQTFTDAGMRKRAVDDIFNHPDWSKLDKGVMSWEETIAHFADNAGFSEIEVRKLMETALSNLQPIQETHDLAIELKESGVPIFLLSDMPEHTYNYLRNKFDFMDLFNGIVVSWQAQMTKREPGIFEYLLEKFSLDAAETVFIDDSQNNIRIAESLGISCIHFKSAADTRNLLAALGFPVKPQF